MWVVPVPAVIRSFGEAVFRVVDVQAALGRGGTGLDVAVGVIRKGPVSPPRAQWVIRPCVS